MSNRNTRSLQSDANRINDNIRAPRVVLIDADGNNRGEVALTEAKRAAQEAGLDLVEVKQGDRDTNTWPVCKILDYGKMRYDQSKKKSQHQKKPSLKEMMFHLRCAEHDLDIKINKIKEFLSKGHPVKFGVTLKGRERSFRGEARQILEEQLGKLSQVSRYDRIIESDRMIMTTLQPVK